jgi:hypothetical protein
VSRLGLESWEPEINIDFVLNPSTAPTRPVQVFAKIGGVVHVIIGRSRLLLT